MVERAPRGSQAEGLEGLPRALVLLFRDALIQAHEDAGEHVNPPARAADEFKLSRRVHHQRLAVWHLEHPPGLGKGTCLEVLPGPPLSLCAHLTADGADLAVEHRWELKHRGLWHGHDSGPTTAVTYASSGRQTPPRWLSGSPRAGRPVPGSRWGMRLLHRQPGAPVRPPHRAALLLPWATLLPYAPSHCPA